MKITDRQKIVLEKIYDFIVYNSYPPTARDVVKIMGFSSPRAATDHFKSLEKKGYIERNSFARSIKLTKKAFGILVQEKNLKDWKNSAVMPSGNFALLPYGIASYRHYQDISYLPLLGRISAGSPILAQENIDEYIAVPESFSGAYGADFALRVKGNSMTGDHILDGDIIMVKAQNTAENGEIVAAIINDEAAVKRFYRTKNGIELRSSNPDYLPVKIINGTGAGSFRIIGRVVAVHRNI